MRRRNDSQRGMYHAEVATAAALAAKYLEETKPKPLTTQQIVTRLSAVAIAIVLLLTGGWHLGQSHKAKKEARIGKNAAASSSFSSSSTSKSGSILSMVHEEEARLVVPRLFTTPDLATAKQSYINAEIEKHGGSKTEIDHTHPLLLTIVGHVFDVTAGKEFYAPGQGYDFFTFRDGSRAFVTGTFTPEGLTDDLTGMTGEECAGVARWLSFFQDKPEYPFVGRLVGTFFDADGKPTYNYLSFRACAAEAHTQTPTGEEGEEEEACATRWVKGEGHTVWCEGEGKVPRKRVKGEGGDARGRCVCVDLTKANAHGGEAAKSLLVYPGCEAHSHSCSFE